MKDRITNLLTLLLVFMAIQWAFWSFFGKPGQPQKQAPTPHPVSVPAGLTLQSDTARQKFASALGEIDAATRTSDKGQQGKLYDQAINDLQDVVKEGEHHEGGLAVSQDGLAAELEIAYIQADLQPNQPGGAETAVTTLNNLLLLRVDPSLQAPVYDPTLRRWSLQSVAKVAGTEDDRVMQQVIRLREHSPQYRFLDFMVRLCRFAGRDYSQAVALIVLGFAVTLLLTPLRNWQYRTSAKISRLQPQVARIQQEYKGQPEEIFRRQQALYKENGTNQFQGCLPALMQWPVTLCLYYAVQAYRFKFTGKFLWIGSSFAIHHIGWATPKGPILAVTLAHMDLPLLIIYTASLYVSMKLMPVSGDSEQIKMSQRMGIMMTLMFPIMFYWGGWPSAFMLYWLAMNVAQMLLTYFYFRHHPDVKRLYTGHADAAVPANGTKGVISRAQILPDSGKNRPIRTVGPSASTRVGSESNSRDSAAPKAAGSNGNGPGGTRRIEPRNRRKMRGRR